MKQLNVRQNILAIESAVGDGGVALFRTGDTRPVEAGSGGASRAEKVIGEIDQLFKTAGIRKSDLGLIAVSIGPGSYSGIRIGVATALGIGNALGVPVVGVSVLEALAEAVADEKVIAVVPIGKSDLAWQVFMADDEGRKRPMSEPALVKNELFSESITKHSNVPIVAAQQYDRYIEEISEHRRKVLRLESTLASAIACLAAERGETFSTPEPIYMRSAVARSTNQKA